MSLSANNIGVPTINYNPSGSIAVPITQGTFQSHESVVTDTPIAPPVGEDYAYDYGSRHVYLRINLGTREELTDPSGAKNIGTPNGYTGIYVKGTILKPGNATVDSANLQHTVAFEHFGTFRYPVGFLSAGYANNLTSNLYSEFVLKSQTWNEANNQIYNSLAPIPNNGMEDAYNYPQYAGQLQYWNSGWTADGSGGLTSDQNSAFPMYLTWPGTVDNPANLYSPMFLNCGINFYSNNQTQVTGFIVKGTYLLL